MPCPSHRVHKPPPIKLVSYNPATSPPDAFSRRAPTPFPPLYRPCTPPLPPHPLPKRLPPLHHLLPPLPHILTTRLLPSIPLRLAPSIVLPHHLLARRPLVALSAHAEPESRPVLAARRHPAVAVHGVELSAE